MTTETRPKRMAFWRTKGGRCYHRDRQCGYLQRAVVRTDEVRFLAEDPGLGASLPGLVRPATGLTACPRCGT